MGGESLVQRRFVARASIGIIGIPLDSKSVHSQQAAEIPSSQSTPQWRAMRYSVAPQRPEATFPMRRRRDTSPKVCSHPPVLDTTSVPANHPLRVIRTMVNKALAEMVIYPPRCTR